MIKNKGKYDSHCRILQYRVLLNYITLMIKYELVMYGKGQNRTEQNGIEQNRTEQNRTEQNTIRSFTLWMRILLSSDAFCTVRSEDLAAYHLLSKQE